MNPVLIFTVHHVLPHFDQITIPPNILEKLILKAQDMGFSFISYDEFKDILFGRQKPSKKQILLTFDDGYYDFYKFAYPVLKKHQIPAVVFIITQTISSEKRLSEPNFKAHKDINYIDDKELFLTLDEIDKMSDLVEFDSHTKSHFVCNEDDKKTIKNELLASYEKIKEIFPQKDEFGFCWPKGEFCKSALEIIRKGPYGFAFSTIDGGFCLGDDIYKIRRIDCSASSKGDGAYLKRIAKKLRIYSTPLFGDFYSKFKDKKYKKLSI